MSFSGRTPESLVTRSDSKDPARTCRGIAASGRPCRRALAAPSPTPSPRPLPARGHGVLAVIEDTHIAAFFCWQHKDQAEQLAQQEQRTSLYPLKEKSSIDTLIDKFGVVDLDEEVRPPRRVHRKKSRTSNEHSITRRETLPTTWQNMQSPVMAVPEKVKEDSTSGRPQKSEYKHGQSNTKFSWACCLHVDDEDEHTRPARPKHRPSPNHNRYTHPSQMTYQRQTVTRKLIPPSTNPARPSPSPSAQKPTSETQHLLSLIPSTLSPQITSSLLAELSRPISTNDEAGYIYIFWLTPDSDTSPDDETASSLLDDTDQRSPIRIHRRDAAIQRHAFVRRPSNNNTLAQPKRTIMLKIGRAQNVHRRMSQWSKQCGQNITLVRYYPQSQAESQPYRSSPSKAQTPSILTKIPNVARVERLIHLELSDKKAVKDKCESCGAVHKEWFEIDATKQGLKGVDDVVRRWVGWSLEQGENGMQSTNANMKQSGVDIAERERRVNGRAWQIADRIRDDAWRDVGNAPIAPNVRRSRYDEHHNDDEDGDGGGYY